MELKNGAAGRSAPATSQGWQLSPQRLAQGLARESVGQSCALKECALLPASLSTSLPAPHVPALGLCPEEARITGRRAGRAGVIHILF